MPVEANTMNYVSAVYGVVCSIIGLDWLVRGRRSYRGQGTRKAEVEDLLRREIMVH